MKATTLREAIDQGHAARREGRLEEALTYYRQALDIAPQSAEASSLYGLVLSHLGKTAEAEPALRKAVEREPQHIGFRMNLADLLERQGRLDEALAAWYVVASQAPDFPRAWERLGDLSLQTQRADQALRHYTRAQALEPSNPAILLKLASAALASNRHQEARQILERAARLAPANPAVFPLQVKVLSALGDWGALERIGAARAQTHPKDPSVWEALANVAFETGRLREAVELYRRVLEHVRDAPRLTAHAQYCLNVSEFAEAEAALAEAEALDPQYTEMLSARALLLTFLGRLEESESYCRHAIARDAAHVPAYRVLNYLKKGRLSDDEVHLLSQLSRRQDLRMTERIPAAFIVADYLDARGDFTQAFAAYEFANGLGVERARSDKLNYDRAKRAALVDQLISLFSAPVAKVQDELGPQPIFIVGMPRSGTTLIESVLSAHSRVSACGERTVMPQVLVDCLIAAKSAGIAGIALERWENWVRAYWYQLPDTGAADHITDKNPFNFESAGLIAQLFPRAQIIHVRRDPIETGLSIYRNLFPKFVSFANRLDDIGHYYGEYARLVKHWERVLGDRFTTIQYEDFVGNFAQAAPALIAACGLEWEEECRDYNKHVRPVATLSAVQVRGRLVRQEDRAPHYHPHLGPLIEALNKAGVDLKTGALR
jgi:tetratricopeptide (TPR) repeat protein